MELNKIYNEDCLEGLKMLNDNSVQMTVTSPPYFNLRRYTDKDKEIGIEDSVEEYINKLEKIFQEIYRITKNDGSCYVNISDTYNKKGSLLCVPDKFKLMMIEIGWVCRNEIIWHKPNAIPNSAKNRFTNDFEKVYFFTKSKYYKFNTQYEERLTEVKQKDKVNKDKVTKSKYKDTSQEVKHRQGMSKDRNDKFIYVRNDLPEQQYFVSFLRDNITKNYLLENSDIKKSTIDHWFRRDKGGFSYPKVDDWKKVRELFDTNDLVFKDVDKGLLTVTKETSDIDKNAHKGRIKRTVWSINTKRLDKSHFAAYPLELIETPILASSNVGDIVLDPFMGSGTTAIGCIKNKRKYIGFELSKEYLNIANDRIKEFISEKELTNK